MHVLRVMGDQRELFGPVASVPTAWRALSEIAAGGDRRRRKVTAAVSRARRHAWAQGIARHCGLPPVLIPDRKLEGVTWGAGPARLPARLSGHLLRRLGAREKTAIGKGEVRERRSGGACADRRCAHQACWIEEAHVAELTGLLREGPGGDQLKAWPKTMRVFARRERPHPGAQLSLLEAEDGWRYTLWVTNGATDTKGRLGQCAYIDAAHRVHARVEDVIRTGKDTGLGHFPSHDYTVNQAWPGASMHPAGLAEAHRPGRRPGQGGAEDAALPRPARRRPPRPRRAAQAPEDRRDLALGRSGRRRLAAHPGHPAPHLTSKNPSRRARKETQGPWNPGNPARQPGRRHTQTLKSRSRNRPPRPPAAAINPCERSGLVLLHGGARRYLMRVGDGIDKFVFTAGLSENAARDSVRETRFYLSSSSMIAT